MGDDVHWGGSGGFTAPPAAQHVAEQPGSNVDGGIQIAIIV
ncbi:MAG: hypothetical protein ACE5R6_01995 [Candidatus Heimdallarchaeota archaeon]